MIPQTDAPVSTPVATRSQSADAVTETTSRPVARGHLQRTRRWLVSYFMLVVLALLIATARIAYGGFFEWGNISNLLSQFAPTGLAGVGMTFVIISGEFDLSVGSIFAIGAVFYATFWQHTDPALAFAGAIVVGLAAGAINGFIVTRLKISSFIVTLGTTSVFSGVAYLYSHSQPVVVANPSFQNLGTGSWLGLPNQVWFLIAAILIGGFVLARTTFGRSIFAVGGNREAARLAGLRVSLVKIGAFMIVGGLAALGGMVQASQTGTGEGDYGATTALNAIAVVVIGGTSLHGGEGAMWKTVVGILILAILNNLFTVLALDTAVQALVEGGVIVMAVALDAYARSVLSRVADAG